MGGRRGGGAQVTAYGARLVARYRAMERKAHAAIVPELGRFARALRKP